MMKAVVCSPSNNVTNYEKRNYENYESGGDDDNLYNVVSWADLN